MNHCIIEMEAKEAKSIALSPAFSYSTVKTQMKQINIRRHVYIQHKSICGPSIKKRFHCYNNMLAVMRTYVKFALFYLLHIYLSCNTHVNVKNHLYTYTHVCTLYMEFLRGFTEMYCFQLLPFLQP